MIYVHTWNLEMETREEFPSNPCYSPTGSCNPSWDFDFEELKEQGKLAIIEKVNEGLTTKAEEEGLIFSDIHIEPEAWITTRTTRRPYGRFQEEIRKYAKLHLKAKVVFESSEPITGESLTLIAMKILKWILKAIVMVIVAWMVIEAVRSWLMSISVTKSIVHTVWYDEEGNIIKEEDSTTEEPPLGGLGGIVIALVFLLFVFLLLGGRKKL